MDALDLETLTGGFLLTAAAGWTAAAAGRTGPWLLPTRSRSTAEIFLRAALVATLMIVAPVALLGFVGGLNSAALTLAAAAFYLASRRGPASRGPASRLPPPPSGLRFGASLRPLGGDLLAFGWPAALTAAVVSIDLLVHLPAAPTGWDAATYHLYFPARWLQEGRLFHVPTVFSDNAAAFAPQNGALYFAWQMGLAARDAVVDVSQLFCLAILAVALYRLCRRLGVGREPAALAALTPVWLAPIRQWTWSANVDVFMVAFWLAALCWQLAYLERPESGTAAASGLAAGLAAGTKTVALPLVALTSLGFIPVLAYQRRWGRLGLYLFCAVAGGGWWYFKNVWLYGNPLFPLDISFAGLPAGWGEHLRLAGAYGGDAVRAGEFHLASPGWVGLAVWRQFGAATSLLIGLGVAFLVAGALADGFRRRRRAVRWAFVAALAIVWAGFFATVVPHNNQARFLLPTVVLSLAGWARALHWARRFGPWGSRGLWLAGIAAATAASRPWRTWGWRIEALAEGEAAPWRWVLAALLLASLAAVVPVLRRRAHGLRATLFSLLGGILIAVLVALAGHHSDLGRRAFMARADFRGWAEGFLPFNGPVDDSSPALRIAYTGANVPYALAGPGWRHRVVYVNTQGGVSDGFFDFWRRDRRVHPYHKPGIYRGRDDLETWLGHLEEQRIQLLVIFRLHRSEARYLHATPSGFPIEQAWARQHPERFEPVFAGPAAEIYRVRPP